MLDINLPSIEHIKVLPCWLHIFFDVVIKLVSGESKVGSDGFCRGLLGIDFVQPDLAAGDWLATVGEFTLEVYWFVPLNSRLTLFWFAVVAFSKLLDTVISDQVVHCPIISSASVSIWEHVLIVAAVTRGLFIEVGDRFRNLLPFDQSGDG